MASKRDEPRRSDIDNAIGAIQYAHDYYCVPADNCDCSEVADRLTKFMETLPEDPE